MIGSTRHVPVLRKEAIELLNLEKGKTVFDATLGGGGYTRKIYEMIMPGGKLIACDQDLRAIERFKQNYPDIAENIYIVHSNYSHIRKVLKNMDILAVDAIVADLGLSSDQIEETDRGFSFSDDGRLDMRMNTEARLSAYEVINEYDFDKLVGIIAKNGDEKYARRIANAICDNRPVQSAKELSKIISEALPQSVRYKSKIHPATKTFQAVRIEVNDEYKHLRTFLTEGIEILQKSGRFSVVSFHSGEDRLVKEVFRANARGCICPPELPICKCKHKASVRIITKKPITPSEIEIQNNSRARSAKLRCAQKI